MTPQRQFECESKLIYSLLCAGKSANFADKAMRALMIEVCLVSGGSVQYFNDDDRKQYTTSELPFAMLKKLTSEQVDACLRKARTGNYTKMAKAIQGILASVLVASDTFESVTPADLESIHGIGPKTARFFIMWIRPGEEYAALDVHILRWLRNNGHPKAPKSTPQAGKTYEFYERAFIAEAKSRGKTPRQFDEEIWTAGASRTQKTATPI